MTTKLYVGNLGRNADSSELERAFEKFGRLSKVWVARNPPGFAFVEYEDYRDAEEAVRELDGANVCDRTIRVEFSNNRGGRDRGGGRPRGRSPPRRRYC
ncbi:predicted protein [Nematostella vectensis]|uniref:RRM domain-containing protein n=1 Tax=Nematostella vectensis TaxID=45351 RepID=A7T1I7_NEMVE|nr:predicted protein [Nematostella vectensis]|eukprot:XP_001622275.1 hypothetical protein NEMVEDRAFT_v1g141804 [Nematostella vectensis]